MQVLHPSAWRINSFESGSAIGVVHNAECRQEIPGHWISTKAGKGIFPSIGFVRYGLLGFHDGKQGSLPQSPDRHTLAIDLRAVFAAACMVDRNRTAMQPRLLYPHTHLT